MMQTTNFVYNKCSHGKKAKTRIFEGPSPSNSQKIALHGFRHSTLTVPLFQEDLDFCSAEQLESDRSMFIIVLRSEA